MTIFKEKCGFQKIGCCTFKPEHCRPKPKDPSDTEPYCDLYDVEFTSKAIKKEIKRVKKQVKEFVGGDLKIKEVKKMLSLEKKSANSKEVVEYKKKVRKLMDFGKGLEYLDRAYIYCKRARL